MIQQQNKISVERSRNIPKVRFPEFKEEWELKHGNELFERISNKNHNSDLPILAISQEFGAIPRELINYKISVTEKSVSSYKVVEKGDFIISLRSFQGGIEYSNYKGICSPAYIILRPSVELDKDFFKSHFKTFRYIQQLKSKLEGIRDGKMVSYKYFSEIKLPFPTLPEQKKIAHFFTTLDKKGSQLQQKKRRLEAYKKGVLQLIMDNGKLKAKKLIRFKPSQSEIDYQIEIGKIKLMKNGKWKIENDCPIIFNSQLSTFHYKDWEVKILGEVLTIGSGKDYKHLKKGDIPVYGSGGYMTSVNEYLYDGESVCIGRKGTIDKPKYFNEKFWTVDTLFYTHSFINVLPKFVFYLFLKINWKMYNEASGVPSLSKKTIESISIEVPTLPEQTKIANFLTKIDQKINAVNTQIEKTKTYKKGLLQRMFV